MMLTDRVKDTELKTYFFVKFMEQKYVDRFREGYIYMNNLKAYVDMERNSQSKGIGDKYEGSLVLQGGQMKFYDDETDEFLFELNVGEVTLTHDEDLLYPVFCSYVIDSDNLEIIEETDDEVTTKIAINDEELEKIIKEFGETAVIIEAQDFFNRFLSTCKSEGYLMDASKVKYYDFSINQKDRVTTFFDDPLLKKAYIKSDYFQHQNEFRFIITNKVISKPLDDFNIGDISDITYETSTESLFKNIKMKFTKDTFK